MSNVNDLVEKIQLRTAKIGVIGLGYVGLPLAVAFAEAGLDTAGFDTDGSKIARLKKSESYVDDIDNSRLIPLIKSSKLSVTASPAHLEDVDAIFICVPTPFDKAKTPDLSFVAAAASTISTFMRQGLLVILQSTTYPGTTREIVKPILEEASGMKAGVDFFLAFSPERVDPGNKNWNVSNTPKVVGGLSEACTRVSRALLDTIVQPPGFVVEVSTPETAEMAKILENTYRAVNIALVNELAILANTMGIDIWEVIEAASSKPFGFQKFVPGIGPGGHCIPIDPHYLAWKAREFDFHTQFIEVAADVNAGMASYVVGRIQDVLNEYQKTLLGSKILCLGAAFKTGVSDTRHSRSIRIMELLVQKGAEVSFADPLVKEINLLGEKYEANEVSESSLSQVDLVVLLVDSSEWPKELIRKSSPLVFDAVNSLQAKSENIRRL